MHSFRHILVYVDASALQSGGPLLERAAQLAEHYQATLKIIDVVPRLGWPAKLTLQHADHVEQLLANEKAEQLGKLAETLQARPISVSTQVRIGPSSVEIIREVQQHHHDLVICRSKGTRSKRRGSLGTTSSKLLRNCPCAVWLSPDDSPLQIRKVLIAIDPNAHDKAHVELNAALIETAKSLREREGCELYIVHVWSLFGEQILLSRLTPTQLDELRSDANSIADDALRQLLSRHDLQLPADKVMLREGDPDLIIPEIVEQQQIDLLMMGTVGRSGMTGFILGNTAETVFNGVGCSILAIKPKLLSARIHDEASSS